MRWATTNGPFKDGIGLVDTMTCIAAGPLYLSATVQNLVVAGLGPDSSGDPIQHIDRLFDISAYLDEPYASCPPSEGTGTESPKFDIHLKEFFLWGESPLFPSRVCHAQDEEKWDIDLQKKNKFGEIPLFYSFSWAKPCTY